MTSIELKPIVAWLQVGKSALQRIGRDRLSRHAAALSFNSLLALAPMLAIALASLSLFSSFEQVGDSLQEFIYGFLLPAAGDDVRTYIEQFASQAGQLTIVGLFMFMVTALLLLFNIEESFNDIWRVKKGRSPLARFPIYIALLTLGPLLMGASLAVSAYLLSQTMLAAGDGVAQYRAFGLSLLPFLFEVVAFLLLYMVMPGVKVRFRHAIWGALVGAGLFEFSRSLFELYILNLANYQVVYGALASLPIFLLWIYLSWMVALLGAEVVAVLQQRAAQDGEEIEEK